jgi:hypothetical protein
LKTKLCLSIQGKVQVVKPLIVIICSHKSLELKSHKNLPHVVIVDEFVGLDSTIKVDVIQKYLAHLLVKGMVHK